MELEVEQEIDAFAHFGKYRSEEERAPGQAGLEETKPAPEKTEEARRSAEEAKTQVPGRRRGDRGAGGGTDIACGRAGADAGTRG